ncbi:MAG: acyltransferase [Paracoccaceae bacterium]
MDASESRQIEAARVICIICMMWVHVNPSLAVPSYVNGGPAYFLGVVLGETMGLISVTTLSFMSGYLFWQTGVKKPLKDIGRRLALAIYLPTLVWSAIFIMLAVGRGMVLGVPATAALRIEPTFLGYLNAWTGLFETTANISLFFIRDLVVSTLLLRLFAPAVRHVPLLLLVAVTVIALFADTRPLLFRPAIFIFMVLGATIAQRGISLTLFARPVVVAIGFATYLAGLIVVASPLHETAIGALADLGRRGGMGVVILAAAHFIQRDFRLQALSSVSRASFLAYLSHSAIIGMMWFAWKVLVGDEMQPSYAVFFLMAPFAVFAMAVLAGKWLDRMAAHAQLLVRGKIFAQAGHARPLPAGQ